LLKQTYRYDIPGLCQTPAQPGGAKKASAVVFRSPNTFQRVVLNDDGRIVDQTCGGKPRIKGCAVKKGLEVGTRLPLCLRRPVELAQLKPDAADQAENGAITGINGDQRSLCCGDLG
jgi:hypothetical protein